MKNVSITGRSLLSIGFVVLASSLTLPVMAIKADVNGSQSGVRCWKTSGFSSEMLLSTLHMRSNYTSRTPSGDVLSACRFAVSSYPTIVISSIKTFLVMSRLASISASFLTKSMTVLTVVSFALL